MLGVLVGNLVDNLVGKLVDDLVDDLVHTPEGLVLCFVDNTTFCFFFLFALYLI